jgi:uncharacterized protein (DUF58 family)
VRRSEWALVLGGAVLGAAIAFGSRPLGVAGIGLVLAATAARAWAQFLRAPVRIIQAAEPSPATEGEEVTLRTVVDRSSGGLVGSAHVRGRLGRLGPFECRLRGRGRRLSGKASLGRVSRGRYVISDAVLELGEPLGLESVSHPVPPATAIVVHPRLVELRSLFSEVGRLGGDGRRMLLRRPVGFDFHSVREYEQGESLRRVHWPTTARRGQLMVKELEDAPRDAVVVLLDCAPACAAGRPPESSFDAAARAAGSVVRMYAARGRRSVLVTTGRSPSAVTVTSLEGDFRAALEALAAADADAPYGLARELGRPSTAAARSGELVVVTAALEAQTVDRLLAAATRQLVSVIWIDAPSFAGRSTRVAPGALRLTAAGICVAVVRRGDDLATALEAPNAEVLANA